MSGLELVDFLRRLPAKTLRLPVAISDGDLEGDRFIPAAPVPSGPAWVAGHGKCEAIVMSRDPQPLPVVAPRQATRRPRQAKAAPRAVGERHGHERAEPPALQGVGLDSATSPRSIGGWMIYGVIEIPPNWLDARVGGADPRAHG